MWWWHEATRIDVRSADSAGSAGKRDFATTRHAIQRAKGIEEAGRGDYVAELSPRHAARAEPSRVSTALPAVPQRAIRHDAATLLADGLGEGSQEDG